MDSLSVSRPTTATVSLFFHGGEGNADSPRSFSAPSLPPGRRRPQEVTQSANPKFLEQVKEKFPDKESKLLIVCSDGRQRAIQVLMLLDAEGYTNIVGLKGGYIDWNFVFKGTGGNPLFQKLERRCAQHPNPPLDPRSLSFSLPPRVADVLSFSSFAGARPSSTPRSTPRTGTTSGSTPRTRPCSARRTTSTLTPTLWTRRPGSSGRTR